jgi:hypothetical protein
MKKIFYAVVATLFMVVPAHAVSIVIDNFLTSQAPVDDTLVDGTAVTNLIAVAGLPVTNRQLSINALAPINLPTQTSTQVVNGNLEVINGVGDDSQVIVTWNLSPGVFGVPLNTITDAGVRFKVVQSDGNPTSATLAIGATGLGNFPIPGNTVNSTLNFALSTSLVDEVNAGGLLRLTLDGVPGWDLALTELDLTFNEVEQPPPSNVPEPGTISLLGIGLLGLGWVSWRRGDSKK